MDNDPKYLSVNCALLHLLYIPSMDLRLPLEMEIEMDCVITCIINTCYANELKIESCMHVSLTSSTL